MSPIQPAVLIVHGAYYLPELLEPFIELLTVAGFLVRCPRLPTCGDSRPPIASFADDVAIVREVASELQKAGHPIIILCHSYGGMVGTEAIIPDMYASPSYDHLCTGVVRMLYVTAYIPMPGQSLMDVFDKHGFHCDVELGVNEDGTAFAKNVTHAWYNDLPLEQAQVHGERHVTHNVGSVATAKITKSPWKDIPTAYVYCSKDLSIKMPLQKAMVQGAEDTRGQKFIQSAEIDAGHCPFISAPTKVLSAVQDVWASAASSKVK